MCLRCCGYTPVGFRSIALVCGHVGHWRAHSAMTLVVCVVCASCRGVGVDRRRACPHRRDVGPLVHSQVPMVSRPLWAQWFCEVVCGNRGRRAHNGYPRGPGRLGERGYDALALLGSFVSLRWWAVVTGGSVHHGDTPLTHDDPGCRTNRNAFTLTGPSQNLRCWFGKGTP